MPTGLAIFCTRLWLLFRSLVDQTELSCLVWLVPFSRRLTAVVKQVFELLSPYAIPLARLRSLELTSHQALYSPYCISVPTLPTSTRTRLYSYLHQRTVQHRHPGPSPLPTIRFTSTRHE
ncbi:hypothetical protein BC567DRAFT_24741 [Phyllosticta citribraziliensis]